MTKKHVNRAKKENILVSANVGNQKNPYSSGRKFICLINFN